MPTALSIASSYPLWAALVGSLASGEPFGPLRATGTLLCVGGVIALVRLAPSQEPGAPGTRGRADLGGLVLDPVYTGKAFHGLLGELKRDPKSLGERIVFVHTGGIFGLFPKAAELAPLL